ncbi:MAG: isoprenylcysteine carboxylmethyltransferase family protein, partial [Pseudomonadota bacterium]
YLFTILLLWTGPVMNLTRLEFAFLGTVYILVGMFLEDRDTVRSMGLEYETYRKNVPMLIPRLTPWRPPATGKGGAG